MHHSRSRFVGLATAALFADSSGFALGQTATPIHAGTSPIDGYLEPYYAQDEGFFQHAGVDVDVQMFATGARISEAILAGAIDVGITNPISVANAVEHGIPLQIFAGGVMYNRDAIVLCVSADSPLKTAKDLNGKTIAAQALEDSNTLHVRAWVDQNGGDSTTLRFAEIPFPAMAAAVQRGTVAAAPIAEPALTPALKTGNLRPFAHTLDVYGKNYMIGAWVGRSDWIAKNAAALHKFVDTIYATARWANAHQYLTANYLVKYVKMEPATARAINRSRCADSLSPSNFQAALDVGYQYKFFSKHLLATDLIARF